MRTTKTAILAAALLVTATACSSSTIIEQAQEECSFEETVADDFRVSDEGKTLTINLTEENMGKNILTYTCYTSELGMPERVSDKIMKTRALDGHMEDSWDDLNAGWTYHPDSGLNLTIFLDD